MARRGQVLHSTPGPAHCAAEMTSQDGDEDLLLIQGRLAAETATDIRSDDTHTVSRHVEQIGQQVSNDARDLRR